MPEDQTTETTLRRRVLEALEELERANAEVRAAVERSSWNFEEVVAELERGVTRAVDLYSRFGVDKNRANLNDAITVARTARHRFQRSLFLLAHAEGTPLAEIARAWGISRQLVSRMVKEADFL